MSDPVLSQWQGSIRGLTFGRGSDYPGIGGVVGAMGTPPLSVHDVTFGLRDGAAGGIDRFTARALKIPLVVAQTTDVLFDTKLSALKTAWANSDDEIQLFVRLGGSQRVYFGRPRGLDDSQLRYHPAFGDGEIRGQFVCLDPFAYGAASASPEQTTTFGMNNLGDARSRRVTLAIRGNGGTPHIVNTTDPDAGDIQWATTLAASSTAEVDLFEQTVTVASVDAADQVTINSLWFDLLPGNNVITISGCAGVTPSWRSAYQ